ncbi:hypothetical protein DL767_004994 [Monosporascus sp. MG133]|nr:hypothetical protein DL767_004994 [Monosporascus sp. MG133]
MATTANEPGQWRIPWDSTTPELFNMFPDSFLSPNGSMTISQSGLWDLSGPAVEADDTTTERRFSDASQRSDNAAAKWTHLPRPEKQIPSIIGHRYRCVNGKATYRTHASATVTNRGRRHNKRRAAGIVNAIEWLAAAKCRQKAKQSVSELQNRERELLQQNRYLTAHAGSLREEVINLKNEILRHSHCDSDLVSVRDIGRFAARALLDPGAWAGRAVGLAGDELTFAEAADIFRRIVGHGMPRLWAPLGRGVRWLVDDAGKSMDWFERVGFGVDIDALRREDEQVQDFESWLRTSSGWVADNKV